MRQDHRQPHLVQHVSRVAVEAELALEVMGRKGSQASLDNTRLPLAAGESEVKMDPLRAVEEWYASVCDGDWEHAYGIKIETLDNPGWAVDIDLLGTPLEGQHLESTVIDRSEDDWIHCRVQDGVFIGRGGRRNLDEILRRFAEWAGIPAT